MTDQLYVHELIDRHARNRPDAVAISSGGVHVTYGELLRRTDSVARRLRDASIERDDLVGIPANRSIASLVAMLGVLKSGAGYVAFHGLPARRFENIRSQAALRVFAGGADALDELPGGADVRITTDTGRGEQADENPIPRPHQGNAAYVVFTSGTTGAPKGIVISHGSLAHSTAARLGVFPRPCTAYLMLSPLVFDAAAAGIYFTLTTGGRLVVPTDEEVADPGLLADLIVHEQVTHLDGVPSQYTALVAYHGVALRDLRCVVLAGEALPTSLVRRHFAVAPETPLFNEYGPTEATVWCTVNEFTAESAEVTEAVPAIAPIGRAIANTDIRVLGADLTELAEGQVGEITVAGPGVARGYLGDPARTAAQFVPDPDHPGRRVYRTGDLGTWESGVLHYRGRMDRMVKVRGYRIELDEVEASLAAHPGLTGAVVIAHETSTGARLAAFAVPRGTEPTVRELKAFLAGTLPDYMIPHTWRRIDALPLTPNGKLDRDSLRPTVPGPQRLPGVALADG